MSEQYETARDLMEVMVQHSQKPGEGNTPFVDAVAEAIDNMGFHIRTVEDPKFPNKSLLIAEAGDPEGEQTLTAISHSDVVGVEDQEWQFNPWKLHEEQGKWFGRGTCDTHGSGVAMLLAAAMPEVQETLGQANKKVSIVFTYDEEATSPELSMRGARLAAGVLGPTAVAESKYFIAGEPTEKGGKVVPMRGHKGRWLAHFAVNVDHSGHVSELVQNAFMSGASIVQEIGSYAKMIRLGSSTDEEARIYQPPHSTIQVSAADVKSGDYSTTPSKARFTVDMRTLPDAHEQRVKEMIDLIVGTRWEPGTTVKLEVLKDADGSLTPEDSPIVKIAEEATGYTARGFNGGDEGRIMRLMAHKEGVTLGPGELGFAHMPDEQVNIQSIFEVAKIYSMLFRKSVELRQT